MKEPERLFASDPDLARVQEMLDRDAPPKGAVERALKRVATGGIGASVSSETSRPRSRGKLWLVTGASVLLMAAAGVTASMRTHATGTTPPSSPVSSAAVPTQVATAEAAEGPPQAAAAQPSMRVEDLPVASAQPPAPPKVDTADPFVEELALVERARSALAKGHGRECLEAVTAYEKRFAKSGVFREEIEVMHIEAMATTGDRAQARARGTRFLESHRDTPYSERLRRVLDQAAD